MFVLVADDSVQGPALHDLHHHVLVRHRLELLIEPTRQNVDDVTGSEAASLIREVVVDVVEGAMTGR